MAFDDLTNIISGIFRGVRESLRERPQLIIIQNRRLISRLRELSRIIENDKLRLLSLYLNLLSLIIEKYATLLLRKEMKRGELKQNLIKAGLSEGEVAIVLRAVSDLDIVTVTDVNGEVDVEDISKSIVEELMRIDERHRSTVIGEIVRFIRDIIPKVCSETQSKVDKLYEDLIGSFDEGWETVHRCIETNLLELDKMVEKMGEV